MEPDDCRSGELEGESDGTEPGCADVQVRGSLFSELQAIAKRL